MSKSISYWSFVFWFCTLLSCTSSGNQTNILFIIADDWSYPHAGVYGDPVVKTPYFDQIAREGLLFHHAYVSSPSCTPSRAAVLTGQHFWRLQEGGNLYGPLKPAYPVYPDLLEKVGYHVGFTDKGWGPGQHEGRPRNPAGERYETFETFLSKRKDNQAFCFWFGSFNPHRGYEKGSGEETGIDIDQIELPGCFPESDVIRNDMADYYKEVQDFDNQIGKLLHQLDSIGELDNTLIVVTSDNGMPFPRCKSNVYDMGTRVPLAIRWGNKTKEADQLNEFVSLTDMAPTFLEAAGVRIPNQMTGKSLLSMIERKAYDQDRSRIFYGKERHVPGQESGDWEGYPSRAIRTKDFLFIKNFKPDGWPSGTPDYQKATFFPAYYSDVDGGPTRTYMVNTKDLDSTHKKLFELTFEKRPAVELYDLRYDPNQLKNVAGQAEFAKQQAQLENELLKELQRTEDPRVNQNEAVFSTYPYTGGTPLPDPFVKENGRYATEKIEAFPSKFVSSRPIEILVPIHVKYDERFPVLYMMDGQNLFHPHPGWGGGINPGWRVDQVLDSLNQAGALYKLIVVGIFNMGMQRMAEYMPEQPYDLVKQRIRNTNHDWYRTFRETPPFSDNFLKFLVEELKPYVDENYMTKPERDDTFIAGSSMGGLISAYAICEYPEVFGGAACLSTHWSPLDGVFLEYIKKNLPDPATHKIYFDYGTEGLDAEYEPFQNIVDLAMEKEGFQKELNWVTRKYPGANHNEQSWYERLHVPLQFLISK